MSRPIINTIRKRLHPIFCKRMAVHVEDVGFSSVSVDVPDDFIVETHFEGGVVGEKVAIYAEDLGSAGETAGKA